MECFFMPVFINFSQIVTEISKILIKSNNQIENNANNTNVDIIQFYHQN
jgi:hypothetical protein